MAIKFRVVLHFSTNKDRDGNYEVNDSREAGTIEVETVDARSIIKALRRDLNLQYDSRKMAPLQRAISTTPYVGGHIDLNERSGKPAGFLERQSS